MRTSTDVVPASVVRVVADGVGLGTDDAAALEAGDVVIMSDKLTGALLAA